MMRRLQLLATICLLAVLAAAQTGSNVDAASQARQRLEPLQPDPVLHAEYAGTYSFGPEDDFVSLGPFAANGNRLTFYDAKTRRTGVLYEVSASEFVGGRLLPDGSIESTEVRATFMRVSHGGLELSWAEQGKCCRKASKEDSYRNQDVFFQNGDVVLHGTIILPNAPGRRPAVVLLHGSGPAARPFGMWQYYLAHHGIATLVFDKRGSGKSSGNWQTAGFEELAADALAGVELLSKHPAIDPQRIGAWGNSNSGWVIPIMAARSPKIAFLIDRVGSPFPPDENVLYEIEQEMRAAEFGEQEITKALSLRRQYYEAIRTNQGWEELRRRAELVQAERWFNAARVARVLSLSVPPDAQTLDGLRKPLFFDPLPYWSKVKCPVLALFGELDRNVPTARAVPVLRDALSTAGNLDFTIVVLPRANHGLAEVGQDGDQNPRVRKYAKGYMDGIIAWLKERTSVAHVRKEIR